MRQTNRKYKIGDYTETSYGNILTIEGIYKEGSGSKTRLILKVGCNICSKDSEMFPESFNIRVDDFTNKKSPCACGGHYKFSKRQNTIRLTRECSKTNKVFIGYNEDYVGNKTKIITYCNLHKTFHYTTDITSFLRGTSRSCDECSSEAKSKATSYSFQEVVNVANATGKYLEGTKFIQSGHCWEVICPICSHDVFVQNELCTGRFLTSAHNLTRGRRPCRCSGSYKYSKEQTEFKIKQEMSKEVRGDTFIGWKGVYTNVDSTFYYNCGGGHGKKEASVNSYLKSKARCRECFNERCEFGLYKSRLGEEDNIYIIRLTSPQESFIKIGRAFNLSRRFVPYRKNYTVDLLMSARARHEDIYKLEQHLQSKYAVFHYEPYIRFSGSTTECFGEVILSYEEELIDELSKLC